MNSKKSQGSCSRLYWLVWWCYTRKHNDIIYITMKMTSFILQWKWHHYLQWNDIIVPSSLVQVLELLPPDWPIVSVRAFLMHSMRSSIDTSRTVKVERNLSKGENVQVKCTQREHNCLALWHKHIQFFWARAYLICCRQHFQVRSQFIQQQGDPIVITEST